MASNRFVEYNISVMADDKPRRSRLKLKEEKKPVNRKLLIVLFLATGAASFFFWWRGKVLRETPPAGEKPGQVQTSVSPVKGTGGKPVKRIAEEKLVTELEEITATTSGRYAVYVYRLEDGSSYGFNQKDRMPAASIMKIPVMVAVWKEISLGNLKLSDTYTLDEADRATGSGPLQFKQAGSNYTVEELLTYLGKNSDNTAWVMFNRRLSKKKMIEAMTEMRMTESSYNDLVITAEDAAWMMKYIYDGKAGGEEGKAAIFEYLSDSIYEDRIPVGFSKIEGVEIVHKVGTDAGVWSDVGIVMPETSGDFQPYVVVILNQNVKRDEATGIIPEIARRIGQFEINSDK